MSLQKLARELDETARQTAALVDGVVAALTLLSDDSVPFQAAKTEAMNMIVLALQGQDRIQQRCHNMALAVRQFAGLPSSAAESDYDEIWSSLVLDELRVPSLSGVAVRHNHGDAELF
jgi:hypothetical protein